MIDIATKCFDRIEAANNLVELVVILKSNDEFLKYKPDQTKYPRLNISISKNELKDNVSKILDDELEPLEKPQFETPLEKLLYALIWKNGDLNKLRHIIKGIRGEEVEGNALTFHQLGRHLADKKEPIIDQHVIRAFVTAKEKRIIAIETLTQKELGYIEKYKKWISAQVSRFDSESDKKDAIFHIDAILFALGKAIKKAAKQ